MTDSALEQFVTRGTAAARAATTPSPPLSSSGYFWFETDTGNSYAWDGSAWVKINTGGGLVLISEVVTSGSQASVNFTSIPSTYRDLVVRVTGRGTNASNTVQVLVRFNGDTANNYDWESYDISTASAANNVNNQNLAVSSVLIGALPGSSATANYASGCKAEVFDYKGTTFNKNGITHLNIVFGTTTGSVYRSQGSIHWRSTSAINAALVFLSAGNFVNGSVVSLYGRF